MREDPHSTTMRRGMSFADAVFNGHSTLDGARVMQVDHMDQVRARRLPNARRSQSQPTGPSRLWSRPLSPGPCG